MEIKVCRSTEFTEHEWKTYTLGFNEVFHRNFSVGFFKNKYLSVYKGYVCHAILLSEEGDAVGGVTVIPCYYYRENEKFVNGLAVDVFIREAYRVDPLMLRRMYKKMCILLEEEGVVAVIAVPNATAYPYWKNVVKWKDVGCINYWMLPVRVGNIIGQKGVLGCVLNLGSLFYCGLVYGVSCLTSLFGTKDKNYKYRTCNEDPYFIKKFDDSSYIKYQNGDIRYIYKLENEDGVKAAYLLNAEEKDVRSFKALMKAVSAVLSNKIDVILYVGKLEFFQTLFIKVPKKVEPKLLPLTCDLISKDEKFADMLDMPNWDFGLKNYDVR